MAGMSRNSGKLAANESLILIREEFDSAEDLLDSISHRAEEQGYVRSDYKTAIILREKEFPTGLDMTVPIAIPHTDEGCVTPFVAVATLSKPVRFYSMDQSGEGIDARIVFQLGVTDGASHLKVLKKLALAFGRAGDMEEIFQAESKPALLEKLNRILDGMLYVVQ